MPLTYKNSFYSQVQEEAGNPSLFTRMGFPQGTRRGGERR
jgi:hypothetical protein